MLNFLFILQIQKISNIFLFSIRDYPYASWMLYNIKCGWKFFTASTDELLLPNIPHLLDWKTTSYYELRSDIQTTFLSIASTSSSPLLDLVLEIKDIEVYPDINNRTKWTLEEYKICMDNLQNHYKSQNNKEIAKFFKKNLTKDDMEIRIHLEERAEILKLKEHDNFINLMSQKIRVLQKNMKNSTTDTEKKKIQESLNETRTAINSQVALTLLGLHKTKNVDFPINHTNFVEEFTESSLKVTCDLQIDTTPLIISGPSISLHPVNTSKVTCAPQLVDTLQINTTPLIISGPSASLHPIHTPQIDTTSSLISGPSFFPVYSSELTCKPPNNTAPTHGPDSHLVNTIKLPQKKHSGRKINTKISSVCAGIGSRIKVLFFVSEQPEWYTGKVIKVKSHTMEVEFDDGDLLEIKLSAKWQLI